MSQRPEKIKNIFSTLRQKTFSLAESVGQKIHAGIELCGEHHFTTGLFALIGLAGVVLSVVDFQWGHDQAVQTSKQLQRVETHFQDSKKTDQIVTSFIQNQKIESQVQEEQIKGHL